MGDVESIPRDVDSIRTRTYPVGPCADGVHVIQSLSVRCVLARAGGGLVGRRNEDAAGPPPRSTTSVISSGEEIVVVVLLGGASWRRDAAGGRGAAPACFCFARSARSS